MFGNLSRALLVTTLALLAASTVACLAAEPAPAQVLFVCEHGNVKSLMAASYFNQQAARRHLAFRAISRGSAPDSTTAPDAIRAGLRADGIDVGDFHPAAVTATDIAASARVITIGTNLPAGSEASEERVERWNDVPAASTDYAASRQSLEEHIEDLLERLAPQSR